MWMILSTLAFICGMLGELRRAEITAVLDA
jgi:hypothetical protein